MIPANLDYVHTEEQCCVVAVIFSPPMTTPLTFLLLSLPVTFTSRNLLANSRFLSTQNNSSMSSFKEKFRDRSETVQRDGTAVRRESNATDSTIYGNKKGTAGVVQVAQPQQYSSQYPQQAPGSLMDARNTNVAPMNAQGSEPIVRGSHHNPGLQGLAPAPAQGVVKDDTSKSSRTRRPIIPTKLEAEPDSPRARQAEEYMKRHQKRLPELPDFKSPPPIMHGRRALRAPDPPPLLGEYNAHTLKDYKKMKEEYNHQRWGGLGPNDSPTLQAERDRRRKMFEYGRSVNAVNFALMDEPKDALYSKNSDCIPRSLSKEGRIGLAKRERALKYGAQFAHPKVQQKARTPQPGDVNNQLAIELQRLLEKHHKDHAEIAKIKQMLDLEER